MYDLEMQSTSTEPPIFSEEGSVGVFPEDMLFLVERRGSGGEVLRVVLPSSSRYDEGSDVVFAEVSICCRS